MQPPPQSLDYCTCGAGAGGGCCGGGAAGGGSLTNSSSWPAGRGGTCSHAAAGPFGSACCGRNAATGGARASCSVDRQLRQQQTSAEGRARLVMEELGVSPATIKAVTAQIAAQETASRACSGAGDGGSSSGGGGVARAGAVGLRGHHHQPRGFGGGLRGGGGGGGGFPGGPQPLPGSSWPQAMHAFDIVSSGDGFDDAPAVSSGVFGEESQVLPPALPLGVVLHVPAGLSRPLSRDAAAALLESGVAALLEIRSRL
jgi:hypothetical protein